MKTIQEMFDYAKTIVDEDEEAFVGFFASSREELLELNINRYQFGMCSRLYIGVTENSFERYCGLQFSHLFIYGNCNLTDRLFLMSRTRNRRDTKVPTGIYFQGYKVTKFESY